MNHRAAHLPAHWQDWVFDHYKLAQGMLTEEFNYSVFIRWEDGSVVHFQNAFFVENKQRKEIVVFTEHCGYHLFRTTGLEDYHMLKIKEHQVIDGN